LLSNAVKYTPREGDIEIAAQQTRGEVVFSVSDTGIGIPSDKTESIFDMFTQIHESSDCRQSGLGIGLTLVKRLVEMHDGSVEVQSRGRNLGSTFTVRLPALSSLPVAVNGARRHAHATPTTVKRRVLVVDDNADALASLSRLVELLGNEVRRALDGLEALEIGRSFQPEIVLMDLGMPNLDGYEAARRIRQEPWGQQLLLIATTGWGQDEHRRRTAEAGFDRHLIKPIPVDLLREVLNETLPHAKTGLSPPASLSSFSGRSA
jgi:CheY-like chemotaxis protein